MEPGGKQVGVRWEIGGNELGTGGNQAGRRWEAGGKSSSESSLGTRWELARKVWCLMTWKG